MTHNFTLEYWMDDGWYVGQLKEVPSVYSQAETLEELENNIREAYQLLREESRFVPPCETRSKEVGVEI